MIEEYQAKQRTISGFFAKQMLFEYHEGLLDPVRHQAVEEAIANDPELKQELKFIKAADEYCKSLSATRMDEDFLLEISKNKSLSEYFFIIFKWSKWPEIVRWTAEAILISAAVVGLIVIVPWANIRDMVDIKKSAAIRFEEEQNRLANIQVEEIEKSIEGPAQSTTSAPAAKPAKTKEAPTTAPAAVVKTPANLSSPTTTVAKTPEPTKAEPAKPVQAKPAIQGLLYRMMMKVPNIGEKASDLRRKIKDMGGLKAGKVEMGWRKPNGNYYHFSFPESRYQNLLSVLGEYGPVRVYKNPHERVMPEGQIRIILWIEDIPKENDESASESASESDTNENINEDSDESNSTQDAEGGEFPTSSSPDEQ